MKTIEDRLWALLRSACLASHPLYCVKCEKSRQQLVPAALQVDHIFPKSIWKQRALDPYNVQLLCPDCNALKGTDVLRAHPDPQAQRETAERFCESLIDLVRKQDQAQRIAQQLIKQQSAAINDLTAEKS